MKSFFLKNLFLFSLFFLAASNHSYGMKEEEIINSSESSYQKMPFKLGFEFQEANRLCPWALEERHIQKKELFSFYNKENKEKLWHIVIDDGDIEFVTKPFTPKEKPLLKKCIETIANSLKQLKKLLTKNSEITFDLWTTEINTLDSGYVEKSENFKTVENKTLKRPKSQENNLEEWSPQFSPQITIQHPLEYSIPLYFSLFGFDSSYMTNFTSSFPGRDYFLSTQKIPDLKKIDDFVQICNQKSQGLVFLHALTLCSMGSDKDKTDAVLLKETKEQFIKYNQIDAKMKLAIMSRRPFSTMVEEILLKDYDKYFRNFMSNNSGFTEAKEFNKTNYAEQFFDENGKPRSLLKYLDLFTEDFIVSNKDILCELLDKGIFSTVMLRNIKEEVKIEDSNISVKNYMEKFYDLAISSVQFPQKRMEIRWDKNRPVFYLTESEYDVLSPPIGLDKDNSMGGFKKNQEKIYGEAIVEVRAIQSVQPWFLKKCKLDDKLSGVFLTKPLECGEQSLKLFDFLNNFGTEVHMKEIYYFGIPYALNKY